MNSWSANRKLYTFLLVLGALAIGVGLPIYLHFHQTPTCFDNKKNGDETGVDCGGSCQLICTANTLPILMKGDPRVLHVSGNVYDVVAYVQNPNTDGMVKQAGYKLEIFSASSTVPLQTINGVTSVPKNSSFAIFNGPLTFASDTPKRAVFIWDEPLKWQKDPTPITRLEVIGQSLLDGNTKPRVTANLHNPGLTSISNIELVALIEDDSGNIIGTSKTVVDTISPGESTPIIFTWPAPFEGTSTAILIVPHIL